MTTLDYKIATEFMGWKYLPESMTNTAKWVDKDCEDVIVWLEWARGKRFSPSSDIEAAYMVLEKIALKCSVNIFNTENKKWVVYGPDPGSGEHNTLPLAISELAIKIMDTPELMELFK